MTTATADSGTDTTTGTADDTSTDTGASATTGTSQTDTGTDTGTESAAEIAKWKALARKHEAESKANKKAREELDAINAAAMSDQEKAVKTAAETARNEARAEVLKEVGGKLAEAAIRVAFAGRNVDVDALITGIDPTKFLDDDGDPDPEAIAKWADKVAPKQEAGSATGQRRDLGQGVRGQAPALNSDQLEKDLRTKLGI